MRTIELYNYLKEHQEEMELHFPSIAELKNGAFVDYEYFTIEKDNCYYYIEGSTSNWLYDLPYISITAYLKIDYNTKRQLRFPAGVESVKDLLEYIEKTEKELKNGYIKPLDKTYPQKINSEFIGSKKTYETEYRTILQRLALGFREKNVLKEMGKIHIDMIQNDGNYKVFEISNDDGESFKIEAISERIVG